ncbi:hypothetical protein [Aquabacterium sp.]|uniref:hypothetical protein n=1 Tax=Aquabacterium sp. TaxID=1872578 RepID=UPI003D6C8C1B
MDHVHVDPAVSSALSRRATVALMLAMALAAVVGLVAWGPVGLVPHMHHFVDEGTWMGVPNGINVLSHVPLIPIGLWGIWRVSRLPSNERLRWIWAWFFLCQMLATLGGMFYHLAPSDSAFIWDQVPKSAACSLFAFAFLAERIDRRFGESPAIATALIASLLGGIWWLYSLHHDGVGDLRPLIWLEMLPVLLVATGAWTLSGHLLSRQDWMRSQISFVVAQTVDWTDGAVFDLTHHAIGGHSVRHLALAACVGWVAYRLGQETVRPQRKTASEAVVDTSTLEVAS